MTHSHQILFPVFKITQNGRKKLLSLKVKARIQRSFHNIGGYSKPLCVSPVVFTFVSICIPPVFTAAPGPVWPLPPNISLYTGSTTSVAHSTTLNQALQPLWHRKGLVVTVHTATLDGQVVSPVDQWYRRWARLLWVEMLWVAPYVQLVVAHQ